MTYLVAFILLAQGILWFRISGSWMFPPALFAISWAGFVAAATIIRFGDHTLTTGALMVFLIGATLFSVGGAAALKCVWMCREKEPTPLKRKRFIQNVITIYSIGLMLLIPVFLITLQRIGFPLAVEEFPAAMRIAFSVSDSDRGGIPRYFVSLTSIGTILAFCSAWLYERKRRDKVTLSLAVIAPLIMNFLTFGRTSIYLLITGTMAIMIFRNTISKRNVLVTLFGGIFLFVLIGVVLGKGPRFEQDRSPAYAIVESLAIYFVGGPVGFGEVMEFPAAVGEQGLSLRFFTQTYSSLGGNITLPDIVTGYISDALGNVYTIYFAYWLDWGWWGITVMSLFAGFFCTAVYALARKGYQAAGVGVGMVIGAILNSATVDLLFSSMIPWILISLIVSFLWYVPIVTFQLEDNRLLEGNTDKQ